MSNEEKRRRRRVQRRRQNEGAPQAPRESRGPDRVQEAVVPRRDRSGQLHRLYPPPDRGASNPQYAHLDGFPLNLVYTALDPPPVPAALPRARSACYWPVPESYHEDAHARAMRYLPGVESPYSVLVVHEKATGAWTVFKRRGATVRWKSHGADFRNAMMHATMVGLAADEPTDDCNDQADS